MKIGEYTKYLRGQLKNIVAETEVESHLRILLEHYAALNRVEIVLKVDEQLEETIQKQIEKAVEELKTHKPIDYIIGESIFMGYSFFVNEAVLIPRSETEELVMLVVDNELHTDISIFDIGTGSGCIPIGLGLEKKYRKIDACDVSIAALEVAKLNAENLGVAVDFFELDILQDLPSQKYEVVVSNPPYVKKEEIENLDANVRDFEPLVALTPLYTNDALIFYKRMIEEANNLLLVGGRFYWEIHEDLGKEILDLFSGKNFDQIELIEDMYGRNRFIKARFKG